MAAACPSFERASVNSQEKTREHSLPTAERPAKTRRSTTPRTSRALRRRKPTSPGLARPVASALLGALLLLAAPRAWAAAPPRVVVEISPKAERHVDARLTRRLVEIELNDADVPPPRGQAERRPSVYLRVLATTPESLRVELWDRGEFYGARRLSSTDVKELLARRIALAAGALVRDMRARRAAEERALARAKQREEEERAAIAEALRWPAVMLEPRLQAAVVGPTDFALAGVGIAGQLRLRSGSRIGVGVSSLFGAADASSGAVGMRWLELSVTPEHAIRASSALDVAVGASLAAAAVHFADARAVDDVEGQLDTWSARAVVRAMIEPRLERHLRLSAGPELGAVLRPMPVVDENGQRQRYGGLWVGVSVGLTIDPAGRK